MGSFNETCALSNLNIPYGTPVRLLFLTQNPYISSDGHEAHRGCYHFDNWFVRTPPIKGVYDDYGRAKLNDSKLPQLIADLFSKDVVERPFGFNQYHEPPVRRGEKLDHYIEAAWEGRLLVRDSFTKPRSQPPESWPTWERVEAILKTKFYLQTKEEKGCNVQPVIPGVVCVHFGSFENKTDKLEKVQEFLAEHYDCKIVNKHSENKEAMPDYCLIVTAKGAFDNPLLIADADKIKHALSFHPERNEDFKLLSVLAVMVREDVWQAFCNLPFKIHAWQKEMTLRFNEQFQSEDVEDLKKVLAEKYNNSVKSHKMLMEGKSKAEALEVFGILGEASYRELIHQIPFQTGPVKHLAYAVESGFEDHEELLQATAELCRVEIIMSRLNRPWYIPPLGGQESHWELHARLLSEFQAIAEKNRKEEDESEDDE